MKAVVIDAYGGNEVIQVAEHEPPEPQSGEVLVKIKAAGVNPVDWKIRNGGGKRMGMTLPIRLGSEVAGVVERVGENVAGLQVGDAVFGMVGAGGFAEYIVTEGANLAPKPTNLDFIQAAGVPLGGLTAWQAMFDVAGLSRDQRIFITNGSGDVGSLAVQIAKANGSHVTAMASAKNESYVRSLGCDAFVDYTIEKFEDVVHDMDVVLDVIGGEVFERAFQTLRTGGFLVTSVAFPGDQTERQGVRVGRVVCKPNGVELASICGLIEAGKIAPRIATVLPLKEVREALRTSESGHADGKIILTLDD